MSIFPALVCMCIMNVPGAPKNGFWSLKYLMKKIFHIMQELYMGASSSVKRTGSNPNTHMTAHNCL